MINGRILRILLIMAVTVAAVSCIGAVSAEGSSLVGDGDYKVGTDLPAGEYYVKCNSYNLYIEVASNESRSIDSIVYNLNTHGGAYITVEDGQYLRIQGGDLYELNKAPDIKPADGKYKDGMYKVDKDIPAGDYEVKSTEKLGYYEIASDSTHKIDKVVKNNNFDGTEKITLEKGQYITLNNGAEIDADAKATADNKTDTSNAKGEKVTIEGIDFNIPDGYKEEKSLSIDKHRQENLGKATGIITQKTFLNSAKDNITIAAIVYENGQTNDKLASQLGPAKTVNGVKGYMYTDNGNAFCFVKDGKLGMILADDSLLDQIVVK